MFFTVYKTTNTVNGKTYIGVHRTEDPNDNYLGSGNLLGKAVRKYGRDAFEKEVLFVFDNPQEMLAKERELVTRAFCKRGDTYNLQRGGVPYWRITGHFDQKTFEEIQALGRAAAKRKIATDPVARQAVRDNGRRQMLKMHENGLSGAAESFKGRHHTKAAKAKIRAALKIAQGGENNSQFGTKWAWVYKEGETTQKVPETDLSAWEDKGWTRGIRPPKLKPPPKPREMYSKLGPSEARKIRDLYGTGKYRQRDLADQFGVSQNQISKIVRGASWGSPDFEGVTLPGGRSRIDFPRK